jgi:hypothetical protein
MGEQFKRKVEDFVCGQCGAEVQGDGYTNHCPRCLWSRHVDVYPGDRAADCGGLMAPVAVEGTVGNYRILHRCQVCGGEKWNQAANEDDFEQLLVIAQQQSNRFSGRMD